MAIPEQDLGLDNVLGHVCHVGKAEHRTALIQSAIGSLLASKGPRCRSLGLVDEFNGLNILISNAAVNPVYGPCLDVSGHRDVNQSVGSSSVQTPEAAWDKIFEINVKAAFLLTQEAMPHLVKSRG